MARSYSNKDSVEYENLRSMSRHHLLEQSFPVTFQNNSSFAQFIAEEKYNLQFFPSFRETRKLAISKKNHKQLMATLQSLSCKIPNNCYSAFNNSNIFDSDQTTSCVTNSSNFSINMSNKSKSEQTKSMIRIHTPATIDVLTVNRRRRMRCIERHISYMNNDQSKAALDFILQLNTYINQNSLDLQKKSNEHYEQSHRIPEQLNELRTTASLDLISTSHSNDEDLVETNDKIDISLQLSDHFDALSPLISKRNDHLIAFYNRSTTNMINMKTAHRRSNDWSLDDDTGVYSVVHVSLEKEGKSQNQQASGSTANTSAKKDIKTRSKMAGVSCCCRPTSENRVEHNSIDHGRIQKERNKNDELRADAPSKPQEQTTFGLPMEKRTHIVDISTVPMKEKQTPSVSLEHNEMEDSKSNTVEINIQQQSTIVNSSLTDSNYDSRKSSADFMNESVERRSSIPLHSRCLVLLELANRDEHRIEVVELPRSFHRVSRIDTYQRLRDRLTIVNLIDIDLTALLRNVLQTFS